MFEQWTKEKGNRYDYWLASVVGEIKMDTETGSCPEESFEGSLGIRCVYSKLTSLESKMKNIMLIATMALSACSAVTPTQTATPRQTVTPTQEQAVPAAGIAPANDSLSDLDAMTFGCPKAGLNAAAREAAKAPTQGHYQFSYFRIVSDSHHSSYEVHFKSNYHGEPDLKYCVSIYCQQGWDSKTSKTTVSLIGSEHRPTDAKAADAAHHADCSGHPKRVQGSESKRRLKKR